MKNNVHGLIQDPIRVGPDQLIGDILALIDKKRYAFSTFPVVDSQGKLVGLLPGHVVKPRYGKRKVAEALTPRKQVHTINRKELGRDAIARAARAQPDAADAPALDNPNMPRLLYNTGLVAPYDVVLGFTIGDEMCLADFGLITPN